MGSYIDSGGAGSGAAGPHAITHEAGGTDELTLAQTQVAGLVAALAAALPKAGGVMTGNIVLAGDPAANLHPATRQYVLAQIAALINGAPGTLDTLNELAAQLSSDESAVTALTATVAGKLAAASNLSDLVNAVTARANLGLGTAATHAHGDYDAAGAAAAAQAASQPLDADLTAIAALATTAFGRSLLAAADAAAARTTLGVAYSTAHVADIYDNRPAASAALNGIRFFATDKMMEWQCIAAAWVLVQAWSPRVTSLPGTPVDGQCCTYVADSANGILWPLRYNAGSASAYKWEAVGQPVSLFSEVLAEESTSSGGSVVTYVALATPGPSVTLPLAGDYEIMQGSASYAGASGNSYTFHSYDIGATGAVDADAVEARGPGGNLPQMPGVRTRRKTGLTAGVALVSKYRTTSVSGSAGNWKNRWMRATPIRVG